MAIQFLFIASETLSGYDSPDPGVIIDFDEIDITRNIQYKGQTLQYSGTVAPTDKNYHLIVYRPVIEPPITIPDDINCVDDDLNNYLK